MKDFMIDMPDTLLDFTWDVDSGLRGNDHFPIYIRLSNHAVHLACSTGDWIKLIGLS